MKLRIGMSGAMRFSVPALPLPPIELRRLVGPTDSSAFNNPDGRGALDDLYDGSQGGFNYTSVLDFGCGCGRIARQMLQQRNAPSKYLGLDINQEAIEWCQNNLSPYSKSFSFAHLNFNNIQFNPAGSSERPTFPTKAESFTLAIAWSVFTHIIEDDVRYFLNECARALSPGGKLFATWFVFDKRYFPQMQTFQNSLYINTMNPCNAVWYDAAFIRTIYQEAGLRICGITPPSIRGFHYNVAAVKSTTGPHLEFPEDSARFGIARPPISRDLDGEN